MKQRIALLLVLVLALSLFAGCADKEPTPTDETEPATTSGVYNAETLNEGLKTIDLYTVDGLSVGDPRLDEVVATCGDYSLTNSQLQFYYWMEYMNFVNGMGGYGVDMSYFGLDSSLPLSEQVSLAEGLNWEQYFLQAALLSFQQVASIATIAAAEGFVLPDEVEDYLSALPDDLAAQAEAYGYESALAFVQETFGTGVTVEDYVEYARLSLCASYYEYEIYGTLTYTDEEIEAYYDENADTFALYGITKDNDTCTVSVRHILITPEEAEDDESDAAMAAALEKAEAILDEYLDDPTEEHFAALANEHSTDPGSNTKGGLYEGVYPGQMVQTFNDWCFDETRQPGDTGIVESSYGYHIMYFVATSDTPYWKECAAQNGFLEEKMNRLVDEMGTTHDISVTPSLIVLSTAEAYGQ